MRCFLCDAEHAWPCWHCGRPLCAEHASAHPWSADEAQTQPASLIECAAAGDAAGVAARLGEVGGRDPHGKTALCHAVLNGHATCVALLLDFDCELWAPSYSRLMVCAGAGDAQGVRRHLAEAGRRNESGQTALMIAAAANEPRCVRLLLAELGAADEDGGTALMAACRGGACVRLLLPEIGMQDHFGRTALDMTERSAPWTELLLAEVRPQGAPGPFCLHTLLQDEPEAQPELEPHKRLDICNEAQERRLVWHSLGLSFAPKLSPRTKRWRFLAQNPLYVRAENAVARARQPARIQGQFAQSQRLRTRLRRQLVAACVSGFFMPGASLPPRLPRLSAHAALDRVRFLRPAFLQLAAALELAVE